MDVNNTTSAVSITQPVVPKSPKHDQQAVPSITELHPVLPPDKPVSDQMEEARAYPSDEDRVGRAINDVNSFFRNEQRKLSFSQNTDVNKVVIEVKDVETDEVIRQIPSDLVLKLAEHLNEISADISGVLFKEQA